MGAGCSSSGAGEPAVKPNGFGSVLPSSASPPHPQLMRNQKTNSSRKIVGTQRIATFAKLEQLVLKCDASDAKEQALRNLMDCFFTVCFVRVLCVCVCALCVCVCV